MQIVDFSFQNYTQREVLVNRIFSNAGTQLILSHVFFLLESDGCIFLSIYLSICIISARFHLPHYLSQYFDSKIRNKPSNRWLLLPQIAKVQHLSNARLGTLWLLHLLYKSRHLQFVQEHRLIY